jgi:hypothetical protein
MDQSHVRIMVRGGERAGSESVPAKRVGENRWELLRSPLYAMDAAAGDVVQLADADSGAFHVIRRGGNVCVQVYLGAHEADDEAATSRVAKHILHLIQPLGGTIDARTRGLISCTLPSRIGFPSIESALIEVVARAAGAQWQYANVYDPVTGEPLEWWEDGTR